MRFTEEQIKEIVSLKESLLEQVDKHQEGIDMLEKNIVVLDLFLKGSSFTKASHLKVREEKPKVVEKPANSIPIKRSDDGAVIANAFVTAEQVSIVLDNGIAINADTPPFKSFFLDRIIGEMSRKDIAEVENGKIQKESVIDCIVNRDGANIKEIIIRNYRQKERVNELINTLGWSLTKMLVRESNE